jgi:hypothetical protein
MRTSFAKTKSAMLLLAVGLTLTPANTPAQASLGISLTNGVVSIFWPTSTVGWSWYPQSADHPGTTTNLWTELATTSRAAGNDITFTNPATGTEKYFRLYDNTSVLLNLFSLNAHATLQTAVDQLAPYVRTQDVFVLVSGNNSGSPDFPNVIYWTTNLHQRFPGNDIWLLTSGLDNVAMVASNRAQIPSQLTTLVYDYEPNWPNEPEFSWDFPTTISNYTTAASIAHAGGFALVGAPTGRPVLESGLQQYNWDYGGLRSQSGTDGMLVQTQTYCKSGKDVFAQALAKLKTQQTAAGFSLDRLHPQISVDTNSVNGVAVPLALDCAREARLAGFPRLSIWLAPPRVDAAVAVLQARVPP